MHTHALSWDSVTQELEEMEDFKTDFDSTRSLAQLAKENGIEAPSKH